MKFVITVVTLGFFFSSPSMATEQMKCHDKVKSQLRSFNIELKDFSLEKDLDGARIYNGINLRIDDNLKRKREIRAILENPKNACSKELGNCEKMAELAREKGEIDERLKRLFDEQDSARISLCTEERSICGKDGTPEHLNKAEPKPYTIRIYRDRSSGNEVKVFLIGNKPMHYIVGDGRYTVELNNQCSVKTVSSGIGNNAMVIDKKRCSSSDESIEEGCSLIGVPLLLSEHDHIQQKSKSPVATRKSL